MDSKALSLSGSKSVINRILMMALYHDIEVCLSNFNRCNDTREMLKIYDVLGKEYQLTDTDLAIKNNPPKIPADIFIHIEEAGTCLRFVLSYFAFCGADSAVIKTGKRLSLRPLTELIECLNTAGANITTNEDTIIIKKGHLKTSTLHIDSSRSSQFLSSVLMLTSSKDIKVKASQVPSKSYIKMTEDVLGLFGYNLLIKDDNQWSVQKSGGEVVGHLDICLDPDYSTLCYVLFRSFLLSEEVALPKMTNIYQPDYDFIDIIKKMGVNIGYHKSQHSITFGEKGIITKTELFFDMADMPDQIITLSFWSLFLHAPTHITGCATLIYKESDRIAGILANIKLLGGKAEYKEGCLTIFPLQTEPQKCTLQTYNDHRFALTFLVLKEKWSYLEIDNIDCINKSAQIF